jgi:CDP-diacylglycerol---glycerol-3-phosphate 3-phosphatidyltransferase
MKLNTPNIITIIRFVIAPVSLYLLISDNGYLKITACFLFVLGAFTDYLDGYFARKYGQITSEGKFFDPLADKILTLSAFIGFIVLGIVNFWMVLIIFIRDFGTTLLRVYSDKKGIEFKTSFSAKLKTFFQMLFIAYILALIYMVNCECIFDDINALNELLYSNLTYYLMLGLTLFTIWTAIEYIIQLLKLKK